jgi:hypothetical protein
MTDLISRSRKRAINAQKANRFPDFTVIKSNDPTSTSNSFVKESTAPEENTTNAKVKFTVVLPPKKIHQENKKQKMTMMIMKVDID